MGAYQRAIKRFGHTRAFRFLLKRALPRIDRAISGLTGGRYTFGGTVAPTLILAHKGRQSGETYKTPLAYVALDRGYAVAGSNWGQTHHPAWSGNLISDPDVVVTVRGKTIPMRARLVLGQERAELWERFVAIWPAYNTYDTRSGDRNIRLFVLDPR